MDGRAFMRVQMFDIDVTGKESHKELFIINHNMAEHYVTGTWLQSTDVCIGVKIFF